jgi:UDP:flavonoid glycosyltransferase YjiC (YdhE family)
MKKALFFPFPGNYGPFVNCHSIATALVTQGYQVGFSETEYYSKLLSCDQFKIIPTLAPKWVGQAKSELKFKSYSRIMGWDTYASFFGFNNYDYLKMYIESQINAVKEFKPDVLIGSWDFTLGITGELLGIPVVSIFQEPMHPNSRGFEWWRENAQRIERPQTNLEIFNRLLKSMKLKTVDCVEELLVKANLLLVPSLPEIDPLPQWEKRGRYIGYLEPVFSSENDNEVVSFIRELKLSGKSWIYVYEHGVSYGLKTLKCLIDLYSNTSICVLISVGLDADLNLFPEAPSNFFYFRHIPQKEVLQNAQLAINHGGFGSVMSCIHYNTPSISIATTSERRYYSMRIDSLKVGVDLVFDELNTMALEKAIKCARSEETRLRLSKLSEKSQHLGGSAKAVEHISNLVK